MAVENDISKITVCTIDCNPDNPDENGKLYDLRETAEYDKPFSVEGYNENVYLASYNNNIIYSLTKNLPLNYETDDFKNLENGSVYSRFVMDVHGEYIFSKKLLTQYGIGFILSDWLEKKTENGVTKVWVHFKTEYMGNWCPNAGEIWDDELYSFYNLKNYEYTVGGVSKNVLYDLVDEGNSEVDSCEEFLKKYGKYDNITYENPFPDAINTKNWRKFLLSRRFPGVKLQKFDYHLESVTEEEQTTYKIVITNGNNDNCLSEAGIGPDGTNLTFIYPHYVGAEHRTPTYVFIRYKFNDFQAALNAATASGVAHQLVKLELLTNWEVAQGGTTYMFYYPGLPSATPNLYNESNDATKYNDIVSHTAVTENGSFVVREQKYTYFPVQMDDITPIHAVTETTLWSYKDFSRYSKATNVFSIVNKNITSVPSADEILNKELEENKLKYQTPTEYYANSLTSFNENVENAFADIGEDRNWFWVDTIKNWCIYIEKDTLLQLMCWNGIDGWDSVFDIMVARNAANLYYLARKYLYSPYFFMDGIAYPNDRWGCFVPIRYPNGVIAQIYYRTLILTGDTNVKNYNNKFQNLHDTKIYQTGERNEIANTGLGARTTQIGTPIPTDSTRQAVFAVPTQYCPVLFKQTNGNIALSYTYYVVGNGYGVNTETNPYHIISPTVANERCRDIFGAGDDKTIDKDWKRYFTLDFTEERSSEIRSSNDDTIYGAASLTFNVAEKKINSITIAANRPNPGTNNKDRQDYIERWDK